MKWTCKWHTYERPGLQMHSFPTHFLVLMPAGIVAKLQPIIWSCISLLMFSYKFLQYFETHLFRTLVYNDLCKFNWDRFRSNYSIDSFKDCLLACKISNQVPTNFEERKVPQAASGNFVQKWLLCKTNVLYNICFFICGQNSLKNMFEVVHTYYRSFSRKIY